MIYNGNHKEWPYNETEHMEDKTMTEYHELEQDKEHEEWMWEQVLKDGPPQDDGLTRIKNEVMFMTVQEVARFAFAASETPGDNELVGKTVQQIKKAVAQL